MKWWDISEKHVIQHDYNTWRRTVLLDFSQDSTQLSKYIPLEITIMFFNNKTKTNLDDFFAVVAIVVVVVAAVVVYKTELE